MSITDITNINVESDRPQFNRFKMDRNEKARILVPNTRIASFRTHVFHNDVPVMKTNDYGRTVPKWDTSSYAGMYICLGHPEVMAKQPRFGDPANCPACAAMHDTNRPKLIESPRNTFALNVIKYTTKPGSYDVRNRNVEALLWKHGDVNKLQPIQLAAGQTDISKIDFLIETDGTEWKKMQINYTLDGAAYLKDAQLKTAVEEAIANELYSDDLLIEACGTKLTKEQMEVEVANLYDQFENSNSKDDSGDDGFEDSSSELPGFEEVPVDELSSLLD